MIKATRCQILLDVASLKFPDGQQFSVPRLAVAISISSARASLSPWVPMAFTATAAWLRKNSRCRRSTQYPKISKGPKDVNMMSTWGIISFCPCSNFIQCLHWHLCVLCTSLICSSLHHKMLLPQSPQVAQGVTRSASWSKTICVFWRLPFWPWQPLWSTTWKCMEMCQIPSLVQVNGPVRGHYVWILAGVFVPSKHHAFFGLSCLLQSHFLFAAVLLNEQSWSVCMATPGSLFWPQNALNQS